LTVGRCISRGFKAGSRAGREPPGRRRWRSTRPPRRSARRSNWRAPRSPSGVAAVVAGHGERDGADEVIGRRVVQAVRGERRVDRGERAGQDQRRRRGARADDADRRVNDRQFARSDDSRTL